MLDAFVPMALKNRAAREAGIATAVRTARLLAAVAGDPAPFMVLADDNGSVPDRTRHAGRISAEHGLSAAEWRVFAEGGTVLHWKCSPKRDCGRFSIIIAPDTSRRLRDRSFSAINGLGRSAWFSTPGTVRMERATAM
jgi:hypothetical protein